MFVFHIGIKEAIGLLCLIGWLGFWVFIGIAGALENRKRKKQRARAEELHQKAEEMKKERGL